MFYVKSDKTVKSHKTVYDVVQHSVWTSVVPGRRLHCPVPTQIGIKPSKEVKPRWSTAVYGVVQRWSTLSVSAPCPLVSRQNVQTVPYCTVSLDEVQGVRHRLSLGQGAYAWCTASLANKSIMYGVVTVSHGCTVSGVRGVRPVWPTVYGVVVYHGVYSRCTTGCTECTAVYRQA